MKIRDEWHRTENMSNGQFTIDPDYVDNLYKIDTIHCPNCQFDTHLPINGFYMVIPDGGLICKCGTIIIRKDTVLC